MNYVMYAIGGMSRREASKSAEKYDPRERKWKTIGKNVLSLRSKALSFISRVVFLVIMSLLFDSSVGSFYLRFKYYLPMVDLNSCVLVQCIPSDKLNSRDIRGSI